MDLREAVALAHEETTAWSLQVTCAQQIHAHFARIAYDNAVKSSVIEDSTLLGARVLERVWPRVSAQGLSHENLAEELRAGALDLCWRYFAIGWILGDPQYQVLPKTAETFRAVLARTPVEERQLLERRFSTEQFLQDRFGQQLSSAATTVSWMFAQRGLSLSPETVASWCTITASLPVFEAYELGVRSRILCEEDSFLASVESQLG